MLLLKHTIGGMFFSSSSFQNFRDDSCFSPFPTSSTLAPTDHPASYLSSRLRLMPIGALCGRHGGFIQDNCLSLPSANFLTLSTNLAATLVYFNGGVKALYFCITTRKSRPTSPDPAQ